MSYTLLLTYTTLTKTQKSEFGHFVTKFNTQIS